MPLARPDHSRIEERRKLVEEVEEVERERKVDSRQNSIEFEMAGSGPSGPTPPPSPPELPPAAAAEAVARAAVAKATEKVAAEVKEVELVAEMMAAAINEVAAVEEMVGAAARVSAVTAGVAEAALAAEPAAQTSTRGDNWPGSSHAPHTGSSNLDRLSPLPASQKESVRASATSSSWSSLGAEDEAITRRAPMQGKFVDEPCLLAMREAIRRHLEDSELEVIVLVEGIDPASSNTFQARHSYMSSDIRFDCGFSPVMSITADGSPHLDWNEFHKCATGTEPTRRGVPSRGLCLPRRTRLLLTATRTRASVCPTPLAVSRSCPSTRRPWWGALTREAIIPRGRCELPSGSGGEGSDWASW